MYFELINREIKDISVLNHDGNLMKHINSLEFDTNTFNSVCVIIY